MDSVDSIILLIIKKKIVKIFVYWICILNVIREVWKYYIFREI